MQFSEVVSVSAAVARARGRNEKRDLLAGLLRRAPAHEIPIIISFLSGSPRQGRIGVGWAIGAQAREIAAAEHASLEIEDVDRAFEAIARAAGRGSGRARADILGRLFAAATPDEQDLLSRLLSGELRQGALEGVLTDAVAQAASASPDAVRQAAMMTGDLGSVAQAALTEGPSALAAYAIQLFRPVEPMLASPAGSVEEAMDELGEAMAELKLDGARVQVHKSDSDVHVYSRSLRDVTGSVPEIVEAVRALPPREVILDGEVLALRTDGRPQPFQESMKRFGRRSDDDELRRALPLTPFFFDCLFFDGSPLVSLAQRDRAMALRDAAGRYVVPQQSVTSASDAARFFDTALAAGHEGIMLKAPDAIYAAGSRGRTWLKIKYVTTLDLVVTAAEWGSGRRRGWLSNLHLAARDPARNRLVMLGKTFKGLTDELLRWQTTALLEREIRREGHIVYVRPELVVEVAFNDLQVSSQYPGGLALRFARVKGYRADKTAADADTLETLQLLYTRLTGLAPPEVEG